MNLLRNSIASRARGCIVVCVLALAACGSVQRGTAESRPTTPADVPATPADVPAAPAADAASHVEPAVSLTRDTASAHNKQIARAAYRLVGIWREEIQTPCDGHAAAPPAQPIRELEFRANGSFAVTWVPWERYHDYWGRYRYDRSTNQLVLTVTGGNFVPPDLDGEGLLTFDARDRVSLREMWLGTPRNATAVRACAATFVRARSAPSRL